MNKHSDVPAIRLRLILLSITGCCVALVALSCLSVRAQGALDQSEELVYIDGNGFIRVLDPDRTAGNAAVQWRSPNGNWYDAALGDVNGDGDAEIVAIGPGPSGDGSDTIRLSVYDPVVASGPTDPEKRINGIPWDVLYETELEGDPLDVATGRFTLNQPQDGIVVGAILPDRTGGSEDTPSRISLFEPTSADGRAWSLRFDRDFSHEWSLIRTGNVDNAGVDEVVLVNEGLSVLAVYRVEYGMSDAEDRIFVNGSESKKWNDAVVAAQQIENQLAAVRAVPKPLASLLVTRYPGRDDEEWEDLYTEWLNPAPLRIFTANVNGNGDEELFLLRDVPQENTVQPRLFMRNLGSDGPASFEAKLDEDNAYRAGAGGNVYGDDGGRDEVVVVRNNNIRVYTRPDVNQDRRDFGRSTNQRTILVGDLDAIGFANRSELVAEPNALDVAIEQGQMRGPFPIDLYNGSSDRALPITYTVQGKPSWIAVAASGQQTPVRFQVYFDAGKLLSGDYRTAIDVTTSYTDVVANSLTIPISLTVESAIFVTPAEAFFAYYPCEGPLAPRTLPLMVSGPAGRTFTAQLAPDTGSEGPVPWARIDPAGGSLPSTITLTVDPEARTADLEEAALIVAESESTGLKQSVPVTLFCAHQRSYLPLIAKE